MNKLDEDKTWECRYCWETQNKEGTCANIAGFICPPCWVSDNYYEEENDSS